MSGKMNNEPRPANSQDPLTDEQLSQLFKLARPHPPARFQTEFWDDLESKLEQPARPSAELAVGGIRWIKQPWAVAAAALVVMLVAVPFTRNLSSPQQDASNMTAQLPSSSQADLKSADKLGAAAPAPSASPAAKTSPAPARPPAPAQQAPAAAGAGRFYNHYSQPRQPAEKAPELDDQVSKPSEGIDKIAKNSELKEESAKQDQVHAKKPGKTSRKAAALDEMGTQLSNLVQDLDGKVKQLKPGSYEIRVPAAHRDELSSRVDQLAEPHNKIERAQKDQDQVVYRVEINNN